jgi:ribose transport system substrate-binding protein
MLKIYKVIFSFFLIFSLLGFNLNAEGVNELPSNLQKAYEGLDADQPTGPSKWRDFKGKDGPYVIGYASSYAGNTWRATALDRLMNQLLPKYKDAGIVSDIIVTQSDLNDATQIQQMRQLIDQNVDAIIICCSNITALNQTIKLAYDKGIPVISWSGYVTSPYALSASANYNDGGYRIAKSIFDQMGGKGNFLLVTGIPGLASSDSYDAGVMKAMEEYPDINLAGTVTGFWTDQVAQTEVQKWLATNPTKIDGIIAQSASETGALKGLLQSGRDIVPVTLGGAAGASCYWRQNPDFVNEGFHIWPPGDEMELAFELVIRTLQGQGPKIQSVARPAPTYSFEDVAAELGEDCSIDSTEWLQPGTKLWFPSSMADSFFLRPAKTL